MQSDSETPVDPAEAAPTPEPQADRFVFVAMIGDDGREPPRDLSDRDADAAWTTVTALWHPALLSLADDLPRFEDVDSPWSPAPNEVRIIASGAVERLASGFRTQAEDAGAVVMEGLGDRLQLVAAILARIGQPGGTRPALDDPCALDFLALGAARWWLRDLTLGMGHVDALDVASLTRETLAGARAWASGDSPAATNRLRAAFELLTEARERFYPVDAYILDLCMLDPGTDPAALTAAFAARAPVSFLSTARAIEALAARDPATLESIRDGVNAGWVDVVGGTYDEADEPFLPLESILWQFRRGGDGYRANLDERNVETLARRRFGLYPLLPQIAKRFGLRFALPMSFDGGIFPVRPESKRLWESPDGTSLEALTRPPVPADRASAGVHLPWRLARTMRDDHVATFPLLHWPEPVSEWYRDLRRVAAYSPVLGRWSTLGDYFHLTDRPYESSQPKPDEYGAPYLAEAVGRGDPDPISARIEHARLRARFDALGWLRALAACLGQSPGEGEIPDQTPSPTALEEAIETGRGETARVALAAIEPPWAAAVARGIVGGSTEGRPGYLVINPLGVARRVPVLLPDANADLRPEGPLRAAQFTEEGVWAVVQLAAHGYAWVPRDPNLDLPPAPFGTIGAREHTLFNESIELNIDPATGGIRGLKASGEPAARIGQQLAINGLTTPDAQPVASRMVADDFEVDYGGPALVQAVARGRLVDARDRVLARFRQRYRLWSGRPIAEIEITLDELDPAWLGRIAAADPWAQNLACRWAWPDPAALLRRTSLLTPAETEAARPETPDAFDITTRRQRTTLLFGGLTHHHRHGGRMLDTLLVAGREHARTFTLAIAADLEHPFQGVFDLNTPALVVPTSAGPPRSGPAGWFFQVDNPAVAVTSVTDLSRSGDGRGWGLAFHLLETAGRPARCRLRMYRDPVWARQVNFHDELVVDLPLDGDSVLIDLTPHELARVDVTLG